MLLETKISLRFHTQLSEMELSGYFGPAETNLTDRRILWTEPDGTNMALIFHNPEGREAMWLVRHSMSQRYRSRNMDHRLRFDFLHRKFVHHAQENLRAKEQVDRVEGIVTEDGDAGDMID